MSIILLFVRLDQHAVLGTFVSAILLAMGEEGSNTLIMTFSRWFD